MVMCKMFIFQGVAGRIVPNQIQREQVWLQSGWWVVFFVRISKIQGKSFSFIRQGKINNVVPKNEVLQVDLFVPLVIMFVHMVTWHSSAEKCHINMDVSKGVACTHIFHQGLVKFGFEFELMLWKYRPFLKIQGKHRESKNPQAPKQYLVGGWQIFSKSFCYRTFITCGGAYIVNHW